MPIGLIFSITVMFFIVSVVALLLTSAADMRRAATQKRLQTLRGGGAKQVITEVARDSMSSDPYIALIPKHLRPDFKRMMESEGFTVNQNEWWHFDYKNWQDYAIYDIAFSEIGKKRKN